MIKNEHQYRVAKAQADKFRSALQALTTNARPTHVHAKLWAAQRAGVLSQLRELEREVREYEQLQARNPDKLEIRSIEELPETLIKARIAWGLTQKELAERLHVKPQQIQRYEASNYQRASFARIREIAGLLGLQFRQRTALRLRMPPQRVGRLRAARS